MRANHPTTLHDIRNFLAAQGHAVPAWSSSRRPLEALYEVLQQQRHDEGFWRDLAALTNRIEDARLRPSAFAGCEALGNADVDGLLTDLRSALPDTDSGPRPMRSWTATLNATALAGFILLGAVVGCDDPVTPDEALCDAAAEYDIAGDDEQAVFCELCDIIDESASSDWVHETLMECIPEMSADAREDLLDEFVNASDEDLANILIGLAQSPECDDDWDDNYNDH